MVRISRIWSIARFDFRSTVRRPAYMCGLVLLPLTCVVLGMLAMYIVPGQARNVRNQIVLVDHSGLALSPGAAKIQTEERLQTALEDLVRARVNVVFELPNDYISSGRVLCYRRETLLPTRTSSAQLNLLTEHLQERLAISMPDPALRDRLVNPVHLQEVMVRADSSEANAVSPSYTADKASRLFVAAVVALGLIALLSFSSSYFLQSVSTERENHVIDVIRFSVTPYELILGKLVGLSAACLAPTLFFIGLSGVGTVWKLPISPARLGLLVAFLPLSYLFMATLMISVGMLIDASRESNLVAVFSTLWAAAPVLGFISGKTWLIDVLTYFPLTSPITMILRISMGVVTTLQATLAAISLLVATGVCLSATAAIMKRMSERAGPRAGLLQLF